METNHHDYLWLKWVWIALFFIFQKFLDSVGSSYRIFEHVRSNFLHFQRVSGKMWLQNRLPSPYWVGDTLGNPGSTPLLEDIRFPDFLMTSALEFQAIMNPRLACVPWNAMDSLDSPLIYTYQSHGSQASFTHLLFQALVGPYVSVIKLC